MTFCISLSPSRIRQQSKFCKDVNDVHLVMSHQYYKVADTDADFNN